MPTVPSTCRSLSSLADEGFIVSRLDSHIPDDRGRPTPDPELDDMVLIPADTGDAVSSSDQELPLPPVHSDHPAKPHITLENLILHSPSSIVGTPFDLSPRFEYPFPSSPSEPNMFMPYSASLHNIPSLLDVGFATSLSTATLPLSAGPRTRADPRGYSPTHPKLHPRDPPVPPGLAKKRRITGAIASARARPRGDSVPLPGADGRDARWPRPSAEAVRLKRASLERTSSDETVVSSVCPDIKVDLVGSVELEVAVEIAPTLAVEDEVAGARVLVQTRGGTGLPSLAMSPEHTQAFAVVSTDACVSDSELEDPPLCSSRDLPLPVVDPALPHEEYPSLPLSFTAQSVPSSATARAARTPPDVLQIGDAQNAS